MVIFELTTNIELPMKEFYQAEKYIKSKLYLLHLDLVFSH
jgi:hypothetical protein